VRDFPSKLKAQDLKMKDSCCSDHHCIDHHCSDNLWVIFIAVNTIAVTFIAVTFIAGIGIPSANPGANLAGSQNTSIIFTATLKSMETFKSKNLRSQFFLKKPSHTQKQPQDY
jgi:hypothetical protein